MIKDGIRPVFNVDDDKEIGDKDGDRYEEESEASEESEPGEEDIEIRDEEEEVLCMPCLPEEGLDSIGIYKPCRPSAEEVEIHNRTHMPFRNWCEICIRARAQNSPHKKLDKEERTMPTIFLDFGYTKEEEGHGNKNKGKPMLVLKDRDTKFTTSFMLRSKGQDEYTITITCRYLERVYGYRKFIL